MRRIIVIMTVLAIALFAAPGNPAFAQGTTALKFYPLSKYADLNLTSYAETNVDANLALGQDTTNERRAQGLKVPVTRPLGRVNLWLKEVGAPADDLTVEIQSNSGGLPSGTVVPNGTSSAVTGTSIGSSYGWVAFDFTAGSTLPQLTAGTQYHLVLKRAGSVDNTNYYVWGADQSSPGYGDGAGSVWNGTTSTWQATSPATDHAFEVRPAFTVDVYVMDVLDTTEPCYPPEYMAACGLGGYQFKVLFDPNVIKYVSVQDGPFLISTGRSAACYNSFGHDPLNGVVTYLCSTLGPTPPGPEGSGFLAPITFIPVAAGTTSLQFQNTLVAEALGTAIPHTTEDGSVTLADFVGPANTDTDGDGCTDLEELGDNPALGGDRNPSFAYDFYDVPVPAKPDPTPNGPKDKAITMSDVLAVLSYVGARVGYPPNPNGLDYDSDKGVDTNGDTIADIPPDGVPDGRDYDRSPSSPSSPSWPFSGAPDNAVTMGDVLAALPQVGHYCTAPPN